MAGKKISSNDAAEILERDTGFMRRSPLHKAEEIGKNYEDLGAYWEKEGNFVKAEDNYRNALIYAYPHDKEKEQEINIKMEQLRLKRKLQYNFPRQKVSNSTLEKMARTLTQKRFGFFSITFLLISLFFVSLNFTGNVILAELNPDISKLLGICFFICGLVFSFIYLKKTK